MQPYDREAPSWGSLNRADAWVQCNTDWQPRSLGYIIARLDYMRQHNMMGEIEYTRLRNSAEALVTCADKGED